MSKERRRAGVKYRNGRTRRSRRRFGGGEDAERIKRKKKGEAKAESLFYSLLGLEEEDMLAHYRLMLDISSVLLLLLFLCRLRRWAGILSPRSCHYIHIYGGIEKGEERRGVGEGREDAPMGSYFIMLMGRA